MKKTLYFKIRLFEAANKVCELTALKAAQFNADQDEFNIQLLFAFAMTVKDVGKITDTSIEIVGENSLCIDVKVNGNWEQGLIVDEIEILNGIYSVDKDDLMSDILIGARYPKN